MSYDGKIKININSNTPPILLNNNSNKTNWAPSISYTQNTKGINPSISLSETNLYNVEIEDGENCFTSNNNAAECINNDELIIKQLEAEIEKLKSEYDAKQEGKGVAGAVGGFFTSCWNGITGKGFKNNAKVELDEKIALLEAAKANPSKLEEAYEEIMGTRLTDKIRNNSAQSQIVANGLSKEEKEEIISLLKEQAGSLTQVMKETKDDQGWFSKAMGGLNNVLGFGTNSRTADAKIEKFIEQVNSLSADDPDFAAKYQKSAIQVQLKPLWITKKRRHQQKK